MNNEQTKTFYKSWAWKKCRLVVLKRDNYLCQLCLESDDITPANTVHHIEHLKDNPLRALDIDNLMSVCPTCHERLHPNRGEDEVEEKEETNKVIKVYEVKGNDEII